MKFAAVIACCAVICVSGSAVDSLAQTPPRLKVGAILPLTGVASEQGELSKRGIEMAVSDLGEQAPEVIFDDSTSQASVAVSSYNKLTKQDGARVIITHGSPMAMALAPLANRDRVLLLSLAAAPAYSTPVDYTFRIVGAAPREAAVVVDAVLNRLHSSAPAVMLVANDYGEGTARAFAAELGSRAKIVYQDSFNPGTTDFRPQLLRLRSARPDVVYVAAWGKDVALLVKQARDLGLAAKFICPQACLHPDLISLAGDAAESMVIVVPADPSSSRFVEAYRARYHEAPTFIPARLYDAVQIVARLGQSCSGAGDAGACLLDGMRGIKNFPGVSFPINFDEFGDLMETFALKTVRGGQFSE